MKTLAENYQISLIQPGGEHGKLPLHLALSHYPPATLTIRFLLETKKEAVKEIEPETGLLPLNMAINLLHLALSQVHLIDEEGFGGGSGGGGGGDGEILEYPRGDYIKIASVADCHIDHEEIATSMETVILRMLEIYPDAISHKSRIDWLPIHYLVYMKAPGSLELFSKFAEAKPESVKIAVNHIQPVVRVETATPTLLPANNLDADAYCSLPTLTRSLSLASLSLMSSTGRNNLSFSNSNNLNAMDADLAHTFTPFNLSLDRGWNEIFAIFKRVSVRLLSNKLKVVVDRGVTESAYGSPRLVTPLPKLNFSKNE